MAHLHPVYDTDPHFFVDSTSRVISYSSKEKLLLVQGDHNCQRYTFEMPRYIDGHDMKLCDRVEVHYTNIDSRNGKGQSYGLYKVSEKTRLFNRILRYHNTNRGHLLHQNQNNHN